ncbi:MAG: hypothetical protein ACREV5_07995 [Steroidobacter sp.]
MKTNAAGAIWMRAVLIAGLLILTPSLASAGLILQDQENGVFQVNAFEPIGQSFTAEDAGVLIAFQMECINCGFPNADALRMDLFSGDGLGGALLASRSFSLISGFAGFFDVDFSALVLSVGSRYTAALSVLGDDPYWGVRVSTTDVYSGGSAYARECQTCGPAAAELAFRVTPVTPVNVSEPGVLALLAVSFTVFLLSRRRRVPSTNLRAA